MFLSYFALKSYLPWLIKKLSVISISLPSRLRVASSYSSSLRTELLYTTRNRPELEGKSLAISQPIIRAVSYPKIMELSSKRPS